MAPLPEMGDVDLSHGPLQVLFGVNLDVARGRSSRYIAPETGVTVPRGTAGEPASG